MKKLSAILIMSFWVCHAMQSIVFAADPLLIENVQLSLKTAETPNRLEVSFDLSESIDLSQENSNIIIEYLSENLESTNYSKDKSWSGYLNSYNAYPSGERKYSSGLTNDNYPDIVPATKIYTSTKTGAKIDVTKVSAVKITALRADGSGEVITVSNDGSILDFEEVEALNNGEIEGPITEQKYGIKIDSATSVLPPNTVLIAEELSSGSMYDIASSLLTNATKFIAFEIRLNSNGAQVQPDGTVKISIPIPENFNNSNLAVYRIDDYGSKILYDVTITADGATEYATFLTDHFSTYVLAEEEPSQAQKDNNQNQNAQLRSERQSAKENKLLGTTEIEENRIPLVSETTEIEENRIPITGKAQTQNYIAVLIFIIGLSLFINLKGISKTR